MQTVGRGADLEDVRMMTMRNEVGGGQGGPPGLKAWERDLVESPEVRRKATVAQLYFLDYYCASLSILAFFFAELARSRLQRVFLSLNGLR